MIGAACARDVRFKGTSAWSDLVFPRATKGGLAHWNHSQVGLHGELWRPGRPGAAPGPRPHLDPVISRPSWPGQRRERYTEEGQLGAAPLRYVQPCAAPQSCTRTCCLRGSHAAEMVAARMMDGPEPVCAERFAGTLNTHTHTQGQVTDARSCIHTSDPQQRSTASLQGSRVTRRSGRHTRGHGSAAEARVRNQRAGRDAQQERATTSVWVFVFSKLLRHCIRVFVQ